VFTGAEMVMLLLNKPSLLNNMLSTLEYQVERLRNDPKNEMLFTICLTILHDFKYMAR
jgi:hypothetical protein